MLAERRHLTSPTDPLPNPKSAPGLEGCQRRERLQLRKAFTIVARGNTPRTGPRKTFFALPGQTRFPPGIAPSAERCRRGAVCPFQGEESLVGLDKGRCPSLRWCRPLAWRREFRTFQSQES